MSKLADLFVTLGMLGRAVFNGMRPLVRWSLLVCGVFTLLLIALACTRIPFDAHRWLGSAAGECTQPADVILVLGGSGMPSGPELVRLYHAAELADQWPGARIWMIHPGTPTVLEAMAAELRLRGVAADRIRLFNRGNSTREQAFILASEEPTDLSLALVTSPENMYRTVRTFRKAGFARACGSAAWDHAMFHNFDYGHEAVGGSAWVPDVSGSPGLRYTFWNYLKLEIICLREYVAITYYKLNGWI